MGLRQTIFWKSELSTEHKAGLPISLYLDAFDDFGSPEIFLRELFPFRLLESLRSLQISDHWKLSVLFLKTL